MNSGIKSDSSAVLNNSSGINFQKGMDCLDMLKTKSEKLKGKDKLCYEQDQSELQNAQYHHSYENYTESTNSREGKIKSNRAAQFIIDIVRKFDQLKQDDQTEQSRQRITGIESLLEELNKLIEGQNESSSQEVVKIKIMKEYQYSMRTLHDQLIETESSLDDNLRERYEMSQKYQNVDKLDKQIKTLYLKLLNSNISLCRGAINHWLDMLNMAAYIHLNQFSQKMKQIQSKFHDLQNILQNQIKQNNFEDLAKSFQKKREEELKKLQTSSGQNESSQSQYSQSQFNSSDFNNSTINISTSIPQNANEVINSNIQSGNSTSISSSNNSYEASISLLQDYDQFEVIQSVTKEEGRTFQSQK